MMMIISASNPLTALASAVNGQFTFLISAPLEAFPDLHKPTCPNFFYAPLSMHAHPLEQLYRAV